MPAEGSSLLLFFESSLQVAILVVVLIILIELNLKDVLEKIVLNTRLGDSRSRLQIASLVQLVGNGSFDDLLPKGNQWLSSSRLVAVLVVAEGTQGDLNLAADEVRTETRVKLHELTLVHYVVKPICK